LKQIGTSVPNGTFELQTGQDGVGERAYVRLEVFTAVTMKNVVFWEIKPSSYFRGDTLRLRYRAQLVNAM
jgi:hypothetical protein